MNPSFNNSINNQPIERLLALRALFFIGNKYTCPCCGWNLRAFTHGGYSLRVRNLGYCPRCNSKSRHRRWWLFLQSQTNLFSDHLRLFHVSPNYCMSRQFSRMPNIDYLGVDLHNHRNIRVKMDLPVTPLISQSFDAVLCIHVLEHVQDDQNAIGELYRVLKPGGWAGISVPIKMDQKTFEDPNIITPKEREKAFGETVHVRYYGYDFIDRLAQAGFQATMFPGNEMDLKTSQKYGLRQDEIIFYCTKGL